MEKDLPEDARPSARDLNFGHPYPIVQESNHYDSDFVKDENEDDGHWKAQNEYDTLRVAYRKGQKDVKKAEAVMNAEKKDRDTAKRGADGAADSLEKDSETAQGAQKKAD